MRRQRKVPPLKELYMLKQVLLFIMPRVFRTPKSSLAHRKKQRKQNRFLRKFQLLILATRPKTIRKKSKKKFRKIVLKLNSFSLIPHQKSNLPIHCESAQLWSFLFLDLKVSKQFFKKITLHLCGYFIII